MSDFGCSRQVLQLDVEQTQDQPMTPNMVTLWYRAPEILRESSSYGLPSDVWSLGITLVEMERGRAPFQCSSEMSMLRDIFDTLGRNGLRPQQSGSRWWGRTYGNQFEELVFGTLGRNGLRPQQSGSRRWGHTYGNQFQELIDKMLVADPGRRISAREASRHSFLDGA